jgi:RNA polymerase sigma factor for flagellar operon FliA
MHALRQLCTKLALPLPLGSAARPYAVGAIEGEFSIPWRIQSMSAQSLDRKNARVEAGLPFVEALARRMAATMPHSIDLSDLVQDGVIGLIDAAERFDEARGIKFETFAERRIRGAMIDALRKDAWPRGVRRVRRELEAAREKLRVTLGHEPSLADLASEIGADEKRLGKTIVRINTIESTSPLSCGDHVDESQLPAVLVPAEPERPDNAYEKLEVRDRVRGAIESLPPRERRVISLYYYGEVTMKEIGAELGVNESRVSQLHARALRRLREALGADTTPAAAIASIRAAVLAFAHKPKMAKAGLAVAATGQRVTNNVVVDYASASRAARSKSPSRNGLASQRQPVSSRNRSASVPATAPVTKMTRRASDGVAAAIAR